MYTPGQGTSGTIRARSPGTQQPTELGMSWVVQRAVQHCCGSGRGDIRQPQKEHERRQARASWTCAHHGRAGGLAISVALNRVWRGQKMGGIRLQRGRPSLPLDLCPLTAPGHRKAAWLWLCPTGPWCLFWLSPLPPWLSSLRFLFPGCGQKVFLTEKVEAWGWIRSGRQKRGGVIHQC